MNSNPIQIGRRAALSGALDALRSFRTLTELVREGATRDGAVEAAHGAAGEIASADALIRGIHDLLGEVSYGVEQPDLFATAVQ